MSGIRPLIALLLISLALPALAQAPASAASKPEVPADGANVLVDRVGNTGFLQLHAESFSSLDPKQKELAYWLSQASIAIDPIIYDQLSRVSDSPEAPAGRNSLASAGNRSGDA